MKFISKIFITLLLFTIGIGVIYAQKPKKKVNNKLEITEGGGIFQELVIIGKTKNNAVWLRWAPNSQSAWDKGNEFGYTLTRTDVRTKQKVELFKRKKPQPESFWRNKVAQNNEKYVSTAYAIYGYKDDKEVKVKDLLEAIDEANRRYVMAIVAADMSFEVAQSASLGFIDSTAKIGETYIYTIGIEVTRAKVQPVVSEDTQPITAGQKVEFPKPEISVKSGKNVAILEWNTQKLQKYYNSYIIESSVKDQQHFTQLNEGAILNATDEEEYTAKFIDTLSNHQTTHYYRLKGIDVFEDEGEYSNVVSAKSIPPIFAPEITKTKLIDSTTLTVDWIFGDSLQTYIKGFVVQQSDSLYGFYQDASPLLVPSARHRLIIPKNLPINIRIAAKIDSSYYVYSFPTTVVASDSIPPERPSGLFAKIDSSGIVSLIWDKNTEKDLKGYYIARRDLSTDTYVRITRDVVIGEFYTDTLDMKLLNRDYFYRVMAVDYRYNVSELSSEFHITKPDIYGPTRPIFTKYLVEDKKVSLSWERSYSKDVATHTLYRKTLPSDAWEVMVVVDDTLINSFTDTTVSEKQLYAYTIIARDDSNNESEPANPLLLETPFFTKKVDFQNFEASFDEKNDKIKLRWQCNNTSQVESFLLYRSIENEEYSILKSLENSVSDWIDYPQQSATIYKYLIRAKMKDGYLSGWKEVTIDIKR